MPLIIHSRTAVSRGRISRVLSNNSEAKTEPVIVRAKLRGKMEIEKTTDDWYTPKWVFDGLGETFDMDVASPGDGSDYCPALTRFTKADDGLAQEWKGLVWINPPYSAPTAWCYRYEVHPEALILIRADLSTRGPYRALKASEAMWVPNGRLAFVNGRGGPSRGVTFSTVMLGRGNRAVQAMFRLAQIAGTTVRLMP